MITFANPIYYKLLGYWNLDGNNANKSDLTGNGYTLVNVGNAASAPFSGKIGGAISFNGSNSQALTSTLLPIGSSLPFTVSFWVNYSQFQDPGARTITFYAPTDTRYSKKQYGLVQVSTGGGGLNQFGNGSPIDYTGIAGAPMVVNQWNHIVISKDELFNFKYYRNGTLYVSSNSTLWPSATGMNMIVGASLLGRYNDAPPYGLIDEIGLWGRVLNANEVTSLYNSGNCRQLYSGV